MDISKKPRGNDNLSRYEGDLSFTDLFDLKQIQTIQDQLSEILDAGVLFTLPDGTPLTHRSRPCRLCEEVIKKAASGRETCREFRNHREAGPNCSPCIRVCPASGLHYAVSAITIDKTVIACLHLGPVREESLRVEDIRLKARETGVNEEEAAAAFGEMTPMALHRLQQTVDLLHLLTNQLSNVAFEKYKNILSLNESRTLIEKQKESEAYLQTLINTIPDLLWMKDREGRFLYCNTRFEDLYGCSGEDIIGHRDNDFVGEKKADEFRINDRKALEMGSSVKNEEEVTFKTDGHREILETIKTPIIREDGQVIGILGIGRDITELKAAEEERIANIELLEALDRIGRTIQTGNDLEQVLNYILDDILDLFQCERAFFIYPCNPDSREWSIPFQKWRPGYQTSLNSGEAYATDDSMRKVFESLRESGSIHEEYRDQITGKDEQAYWEKLNIQSLLAFPLYPKTGEPWYLGIHSCRAGRRWTPREKKLFRKIGIRLTDSLTNLLMFRDIEKNEDFLRTILDHIPNMIFIKSANNLAFVNLNRAGEQLSGLNKEDFLGKNDYDFFPKEIADSYSARERAILESGRTLEIPRETIQTADHVEHILHTRKIPIMDSRGNPQFLLSISEDITDKLKAEKELDEKREWLQSFIESTDDAITIYDRDNRVVLVNSRAMEFYPEEMKKSILGTRLDDIVQLYPEEAIQNFNQVRTTGKPMEFTLENKREEMYYYRHKLFPVGEGIGIISSDITEQTKLENQMRQIQKNESIGRLAGGVAHDYNNILGIIMGYAEMARNYPDKDDTLNSYLDEILKATEKSAALTRQLLTFARKQNISPRILNLNEAIAGMLNMLKTLLGEHIDLIWRPSDDLWKVKADPVQIDQVLANLCVNARDAIEDTGRIVIESDNRRLDENYCRLHPEIQPGDYVSLTVSDTGAGMDRETMSRIFEPFFTTKEVGKGTGLGLSTVYGIIKQNNGSVSVYSEPGTGTSFIIFLPREISNSERQSITHEGPNLGGTETILLIEDDENLLKMTELMLRALGYKVLSAGSKEEALKISGDRSKKIHLILSDIIMPEMNGRDLTELIRKDRPGTKCLFMSGYTNEIITRHDILEEGINFIQKPFSAGDLGKSLRRVLDED